MPGKLEQLTPEQLALLIPLFAITISDNLPRDEVEELGAFITAVGDTVSTIGVQRALLEGETAQQMETGGAEANSPAARQPDTGGAK